VTALYFRKHHHFNISTKYITYYLMHWLYFHKQFMCG
jgi:hypothetical protein